MIKQIKLKAQLRKEKGGKILTRGLIPAIMYGSGIEPQKLKVKSLDFENVFALAGESHLIDLDIEDKEPAKVIVKDIQKNAVKNKIIHVDFYKVDMKKEIVAQIPLRFVGESKAVKELGGILIKNLDTLEVECLPSDLVDYIEVDLSVLNAIRDVVRVNDLKLPKGMSPVSETNEVAVSVAEPAKEEKEEAPAPLAVEGEQPKEEKTEEEKEAKVKK